MSSYDKVSKGLPLSIRLRPSVRAALAREAELQRRSLSNLLETILEGYVETRLTDEHKTWEAFWHDIHQEAAERGASSMTPEDIVAEIHHHRRGKPSGGRG